MQNQRFWRRAQKIDLDHALLAAIVASSEDAILGATVDGIITAWNHGAERLLGYTADQVIGKSITLLLPQDRRDDEAWYLKRVRDGSRIEHEETVRQTRDGRLIDVAVTISPIHSADGTVIGVSKILHDITDRTRARAALQESERRYRTLFEQAPVGMVEVDFDGRFRRVNPRFCHIVGYPCEDLEGGSIQNITHPDDSPADAEMLRRLSTGEIDSMQREKRYVRKDESVVWVSVSVTLVRSSDGKPLHALAAVADVTDRRHADDALRQARDIAEQANRAKDQFLAVLSHELRTPLTPVLLTASALHRDTSLPAEVREELAMMRDQVELEARLIDDLLDLTRIGRGKFLLDRVAVDAHDVLARVIDASKPAFDAAGLNLTVEWSATNRALYADPARMQQLFGNLLNNAAKFTPQGGAITVRTSDDHLGQTPALRVEVRDTGIGIEPEILPRLFNAFEQGESTITRRFGGLGLGLTIGKAIAELHGGTIEATSEGKDRGAVFTVLLPAEPSITPVPHKPTPAPLKKGRGVRLLLVEDHHPTLLLLRKLLTSMGHQVLTADSLTSARAVAASESFDLLLSDIGLPDGSGWDVLAHINARTTAEGRGLIPAIALSGFGTDEDIARSKTAGFAEHLVKPVDVTKLQEAMERLVRRGA